MPPRPHTSTILLAGWVQVNLGVVLGNNNDYAEVRPPPSDLVQGAEPPIYQDEINARRAANSADPVENNLPFLRPAPHRPARPRRQSRSTAARSSSRRT